MRYSHFYNRSKRSVARQDSINAYLLDKAGFVSQTSAGSYSLMPMGLRVVKKIEQIIREEMERIGASELVMSSLQPKSLWEKTGRWKSMKDILFKDAQEQNCFAPTHEELLTSILTQTVKSYRDLPVYLYQFQTKFRNELRAKSGLLRVREFIMKDLYSFDLGEKEHQIFYEKAADAYIRAFKRMSLEVYRIKASGGDFSKEFSDEFQVLCETGEDEILYDKKTKLGFNKEIEKQITEKDRKSLERSRAIEVGNIFHLGKKYSSDFKLEYLNAGGKKKPVIMGSYGFGVTRILGAIAEISNDKDGLIWPKSVAPFQVYLVDLTESKVGERLERELMAEGLEVLFDDRDEAPGVKLVESDLIGLPVRLLYSAKTAQEGRVEIKHRLDGKIGMVDKKEAVKKIFQYLS